VTSLGDGFSVPPLLILSDRPLLGDSLNPLPDLIVSDPLLEGDVLDPALALDHLAANLGGGQAHSRGSHHSGGGNGQSRGEGLLDVGVVARGCCTYS
jgi:hypothetical protein